MVDSTLDSGPSPRRKGTQKEAAKSSQSPSTLFAHWAQVINMAATIPTIMSVIQGIRGELAGPNTALLYMVLPTFMPAQAKLTPTMADPILPHCVPSHIFMQEIEFMDMQRTT